MTLRGIMATLAALSGSVVMHLTGAGLATGTQEAVQIEGGTMVQVAMLGNSFEDMVTGAVARPQVAPPVQTRPETLPAQTAETTPVTPTEVPLLPTADLPAQAPSPAPHTAVAAPPMMTSAPVETLTAQDPPPHPKPAAKAPEASPGNGAQNRARGQADGRKTAKAVTAKTATGASGAAPGNARLSNYKGQIMRKIAQQRKKSAGARGTAAVAFRIAGSGAIAGVSIVTSSGDSRIDRVAVEHIRRSGPFPPPPGGQQLSFVVRFESKG
ncbi:energy transducer TonB family protein [Actibacterium sp. D379-3]